MMHAHSTVEFFDLDGTCNDFDILSVLQGKGGSPEVAAYLEATADFISRQIPSLAPLETLEGVRSSLLHDVFPLRSQHRYWAAFPSAQKSMLPVCPSVDHYLLTPHGVRFFLESRLQRADVGIALRREIENFFASANWSYELFKFASAASLPFAVIDDDARTVLDRRLSVNAFVVILTNSSTEKARVLATRAGFARSLIEGRLERGKLAIIGEARKFVIDRDWPPSTQPEHVRFGATLDLSRYFGESAAVVDLRRRHFYETVKTLVQQAGAKSAWMVSDIASLDLFPFANWLEFNPRVAMRVNSVSSSEEIQAVRDLLGIQPAPTLSAAMAD